MVENGLSVLAVQFMSISFIVNSYSITFSCDLENSAHLPFWRVEMLFSPQIFLVYLFLSHFCDFFWLIFLALKSEWEALVSLWRFNVLITTTFQQKTGHRPQDQWLYNFKEGWGCFALFSPDFNWLMPLRPLQTLIHGLFYECRLSSKWHCLGSWPLPVLCEKVTRWRWSQRMSATPSMGGVRNRTYMNGMQALGITRDGNWLCNFLYQWRWQRVEDDKSLC